MLINAILPATLFLLPLTGEHPLNRPSKCQILIHDAERWCHTNLYRTTTAVRYHFCTLWYLSRYGYKRRDLFEISLGVIACRPDSKPAITKDAPSSP